MAGNTRQWAKDKLDSAVKHLETAGQYLQEVETVYDAQHPEVGIVTQAIKTGLVLDIDMVNQLNATL